jgi:ribosomal protein S18 acetylase RimI-like enzyme
VRARAAVIRGYDPARDAAGLRACYVALQDALHALDPELPAGERVADAYLACMLRRCAAWDGAVLVALVDGRLVGFACVWARVPPEPDEGAAYAFVSDLAVLPPFRGRGIGRELLAGAERHARTHGAAVLRLDVLAANVDARRLYEDAGFGTHLVRMAKPLR